MSAITGARPCPTLTELPPPLDGHTGWPWTQESPRIGSWRQNGTHWPRVTVVTPSYNQAAFLEETIRSVLLQGYPDLEYIVMDGGSTDGSREIIARYAPWLSAWASERDRGQSHAINKGFSHATTEIQAWLNSDDTYYPGAIVRAVRALPEGADIIIGGMDKVERNGADWRIVKRSTPARGNVMHPARVLSSGRRADFHFIQPPMFWRQAIWRKTGGLDERYHYVMDVEWCNRALAAGAVVATFEEPLVRFRVHPAAKTHDIGRAQLRERALMYIRLSRRPGFDMLRCLAASLPPARRMCAVGARADRAAGRPFRAATMRVASRVLDGVERGIRPFTAGGVADR